MANRLYFFTEYNPVKFTIQIASSFGVTYDNASKRIWFG